MKLEFKINSESLRKIKEFREKYQDMIIAQLVETLDYIELGMQFPRRSAVKSVDINITLFPTNTKFKILSDFFIYDGWHESTNIKGAIADYVKSNANNKVTLDYMGKQLDFDLTAYKYETINEPTKTKEFKDEFYDRQEYEDFDGIILQDKDKKYWF